MRSTISFQPSTQFPIIFQLLSGATLLAKSIMSEAFNALPRTISHLSPDCGMFAIPPHLS